MPSSQASGRAAEWPGQRRACFLAFAVLLASRGIAAPSLDFVAAEYRPPQVCSYDGGSVRATLVNVGPTVLVIRDLTVNGVSQWPRAEPLPPVALVAPRRLSECFPQRGDHGSGVLWAWVTRAALGPGEACECVVRFLPPPPSGGPVTLRVSGDAVAECTVLTEYRGSRISAVEFAKDRRKVYVYVENNSPQPVAIASAALVGRDVLAEVPHPVVLPGQKGHACLDTGRSLPAGERVYAVVSLCDGRRLALSAMAYSGFPILPVGDVPSSALYGDDGVPTQSILREHWQYHGRQDIIAGRVMDAMPARTRALPEAVPHIVTNQVFAPLAAVSIGDLAPCFFVGCDDLDTSSVGPFSPADATYIHAKARFLKEAILPNKLWLMLRLHYGYGHFRQALSAAELRLKVYDAVSCGAKGVAFRSDAKWYEYPTGVRAELQDALRRTLVELSCVRELLCFAEPCAAMAQSTEPLIEPAVLLCGDLARVVLLLDRDVESTWPLAPGRRGATVRVAPIRRMFTVNVRVPDSGTSADVFDAFEPEGAIQTEPLDGAVSIRVDGIEDVRVLVVPLRPGVRDLCTKGWRRAIACPSPGEDTRDPVDLLIDEVTSGRRPTRAPGAGRLPLLEGRTITAEPHLEVPVKARDLGLVDPSAGESTERFTVRNVGSRPLSLSIDSCEGPVRAGLTDDVLRPGSTGYVTAVLATDVGSPTGRRVRGTVVLRTTDPEEDVVRLVLGATVMPAVVCSVERMRLHRGRAAGLEIWDLHREGLRIDGVSCDLPGVSWTIREEYEEADLNAGDFRHLLGRHHWFVLSLLADGPPSAGSRRVGCLAVRTNSPWCPLTTIPITVEGRSGISLLPGTVFFGVVRRGEKVTRECRMVADQGFPVLCSVRPAPSFELRTLPQPRGGRDVLLAVSFTGDEVGTRSQDLAAEVECDGRREEVSIHCSAIVVP